MNKKEALITLVEASLILSDEDRLRFLDLIPGLNDNQVDVLGKFLATEREFILAHENDIRMKIDETLETLETSQNDNAVFVGVGKPTN